MGVLLKKAVLPAFLLLLAVLFIVPWQPRMPAAGLDPSWQLIIEHALLNSLQFGKDVVFTFGPLGFLYTGLFHPDTYVWLVLTWTAFSALLVGALLALRPNASILPVVAILFAIVEGAVISTDGFLLMTPLLLIALQTTRPESRILATALAVVLAAFALSKFTTVLIAALVIAIVAAVDIAKHRRAPLPFLAFLASFALLYHWSGQQFSSLVPYISGALEISSGYSRAMQVKGSWTEIVAFLGLSVLLALAFVAMEFRHARSRREVLAPAGLVAALLLSLFIVFKAAFVRHDGHALFGWGGLVLAAAFLTGRARFTSGAFGGAILLAFGAAALAGAVLSHRHHYADEPDWPLNVLTTAEIATRADGLTASLLDWPARVRTLDGQRRTALAKIRSDHPVGPIEGSVDLFTVDQAILFAHGLDYTPRPVFQSYSAYTANLIERNRSFFEGENRPRNVLFMPAAIDERFPALDSGALWPTLMQGYDAVDLRDGFALLRERPQPRAVSLTPLAEASTTFDTPVALPDSNGPLWVRIDLQRTTSGKLLTTVYKEPLVFIHAEFGAMGWRTWRLIPSMSAAGFILSPVVENTAEFLSVFMQPEHAKRLSAKRPTAIKITTTGLGTRFFAPRIRVAFDEVRATPVPMADGLKPVLSDLESRNALMRLASSWKNATPIAPEIRGGGPLLAHAPMALSLPIEGVVTGDADTGSLRVGFGMFDGAWSQGGHTDGVCFEIWSEADSGEGERLWRRCLNPVEIEADRGEQSATIPIPRRPATRLRFVTDAGPTNAWDWSYWSRISAVVP